MPTLPAPDGTLLVYDMYEAAAPRAAVLALHGWADHAGRWRDVGERLCAAGYSTYFLDLRGHGRSGGRSGHLSRFSQLLGDLQAFRRVVRLRTDRPQLLLGMSFGGLVALRYLETQPSDPIVAAVICCPWLGLARSEEHTSELQSLAYLVCRLLLEKKKKNKQNTLCVEAILYDAD